MNSRIDAAATAPSGFRGKSATFGKRVLRRGADWARALVERPDRTAPVIVALLIGVSAAAVGVSGLESLREQDRLRAALAAEVVRLEEEATGLRNSIGSMKDDPAAFELHAKTYHQLVESGEVVVLLRFPEPSDPARP